MHWHLALNGSVAADGAPGMADDRVTSVVAMEATVGSCDCEPSESGPAVRLTAVSTSSELWSHHDSMSAP
jgi:hypothetical protein